MIDKVLAWCAVGIYLIAAIYCLFGGLRVLNIVWNAANHSVSKTLNTLIDLYLPVMFPMVVALFLVSLFKILGR